MATNYKVLGQALPAANTATSLYTVPTNTQAVVSNIHVCNTGAAAATYRIAIRPSGAALSSVHYYAFDAAIAPGKNGSYVEGLTLGAGDVITVLSNTGTVTFHAFGSEIA